MIYLDANATTPMPPAAIAAWTEAAETWGNPSSTHAVGRSARLAWSTALADAVALLAVPDSHRLVVTGGASEALSGLISGLAEVSETRVAWCHATAHPAVPANLERSGWEVVTLPVDGAGCIGLPTTAAAPGPELVVIEAANGETGCIQALDELLPALRALAPTAAIVVDACQLAGRWALPAAIWAADAVIMSPHKAGGPKGVGLAMMRHGKDWPSLVAGGGQQHGWRSGTEDLASLAASVGGIRTTLAAWQHHGERVAEVVDAAWQRLQAARPATVRFGADGPHLPNTLAFAHPGVRASQLVAALDLADIAVSQGSACGSNHDRPNGTLLAMGVDADLARGLVRVSALPSVTSAELTTAIDIVIDTLGRLVGR